MKLKAWSLVLPLAIAGVLASAVSYIGVAQQAPPAANAAPDLPPGPGREPFQHICTGCHLASVVTNERHNADGWAGIVDDMRSRGASGSDEDMDKITAWLATNYPAPVHVNINSADASAIVAGLALTNDQATAIVAYRAKNGKFKDLAGLELVPGTDKDKIEAAKDRIDF